MSTGSSGRGANPHARRRELTSKQPGRLKLVGRVALGAHPAGLSRIAWGLRVRAHRLGAGDYLAELEARIDSVLTTDGPAVNFDVGPRRKLTIVAQSCPARLRRCDSRDSLLNNR
jgi:hypothetical protein